MIIWAGRVRCAYHTYAPEGTTLPPEVRTAYPTLLPEVRTAYPTLLPQVRTAYPTFLADCHAVPRQLHGFNGRFVGIGFETRCFQIDGEGVPHCPTDDGIAFIIAQVDMNILFDDVVRLDFLDPVELMADTDIFDHAFFQGDLNLARLRGHDHLPRLFASFRQTLHIGSGGVGNVQTGHF